MIQNPVFSIRFLQHLLRRHVFKDDVQ
jgi:hypothetical protein